jgi:hypothetical protein
MEKPEKRTMTLRPEFKPGVYRHYKGGLYHALFLARQNETITPNISVVVYISMTTGDIYTRPYSDPRFDSWTDQVRLDHGWVTRFTYVGIQEVKPAVDGTA